MLPWDLFRMGHVSRHFRHLSSSDHLWNPIIGDSTLIQMSSLFFLAKRWLPVWKHAYETDLTPLDDDLSTPISSLGFFPRVFQFSLGDFEYLKGLRHPTPAVLALGHHHPYERFDHKRYDGFFDDSILRTKEEEPLDSEEGVEVTFPLPEDFEGKRGEWRLRTLAPFRAVEFERGHGTVDAVKRRPEVKRAECFSRSCFCFVPSVALILVFFSIICYIVGNLLIDQKGLTYGLGCGLGALSSLLCFVSPVVGIVMHEVFIPRIRKRRIDKAKAYARLISPLLLFTAKSWWVEPSEHFLDSPVFYAPLRQSVTNVRQNRFLHANVMPVAVASKLMCCVVPVTVCSLGASFFLAWGSLFLLILSFVVIMSCLLIYYALLRQHDPKEYNGTSVKRNYCFLVVFFVLTVWSFFVLGFSSAVVAFVDDEIITPFRIVYGVLFSVLAAASMVVFIGVVISWPKTFFHLDPVDWSRCVECQDLISSVLRCQWYQRHFDAYQYGDNTSCDWIAGMTVKCLALWPLLLIGVVLFAFGVIPGWVALIISLNVPIGALLLLSFMYCADNRTVEW